MKKYIGIFVVAVMVCGLMSCGNSKTPATEQNETKVTEIELEDDIASEDTSAVTRGESGSEGFGRCFESGCYCKAFKGRDQTCQNCGHAYRRHY